MNYLALHKRTIIAFTGLAGAGKSTAARHLIERHGFERVRFAGPLKDMMRALGLTESQIDGSDKELPCELLGGKTPRWAMQTIGTEWGRNLIHRDIWVKAWRAAVDRLPVAVPVVVDDCRFPNETLAVQKAGGVIIRIDRPGIERGDHASELYDLPYTLAVRNIGLIEHLLAEVDHAIRDLSWVIAARS